MVTSPDLAARRDGALEQAAEICDQTAAAYAAYADQPRRSPEERAALNRDWQTCADLAARIRKIKGRDGEYHHVFGGQDATA